MSDIKNAFCPDMDCKDYGVRNQGNIRKRGEYGRDKKRNKTQSQTESHLTGNIV